MRKSYKLRSLHSSVTALLTDSELFQTSSFGLKLPTPELTLNGDSFRPRVKFHTWHGNTCLNVRSSEHRCNLHDTTTSQPCPRKFTMFSKNAKVRLFSYLYSTSFEYALRSQISKCYCSCSDNGIWGALAGKSWQLLLNSLAEPDISLTSPSGRRADSVNTVTVEKEKLCRATQFGVLGYPAKLMNRLSAIFGKKALLGVHMLQTAVM